MGDASKSVFKLINQNITLFLKNEYCLSHHIPWGRRRLPENWPTHLNCGNSRPIVAVERSSKNGSATSGEPPAVPHA